MAASSSAAMRSSRSKRFKSVADGSNPRARTASAYARSWLSLLRASHPCSLMAARSLVSESPSTSFIPLAMRRDAVAQDVRGEQVRAVRQAKGGVEQVVAPAHRAHHRRSHRLHLRAKVRLHRLAVLVHSRVQPSAC